MKWSWMINGMIVVLAVGAGMMLSIQPWQVYMDQRRSADHSVAEMRLSEAKRESLVRQEARMKGSIGKEELARGRGWLPPGEIAAPKAETQ
ncbi:hypothetical protein BH11ARM1_BH11ARM1_13650 [soil metagenome]